MEYREPLDIYDMKPFEMVAYLRYNGWHFNNKLSEWASKRMKRKNTSTDKLEPIEPWTKGQVDDLLARVGIKMENAVGADYVYVANMAKADFFKSSLSTEEDVAKFVKDMVDDPDQADGFILSRFYSDCVKAGVGIPWSEVI